MVVTMTAGTSHWKLVRGTNGFRSAPAMPWDAAGSSGYPLRGGTSLCTPRWIILPLASLTVTPVRGLALPLPFFLKHIGLAISLHSYVIGSLYLKAAPVLEFSWSPPPTPESREFSITNRYIASSSLSSSGPEGRSWSIIFSKIPIS